ncbi:MAG: hypothetical protein ACK58T_39420, partial [Phycisphaerae bacterium]
MRGSSDWLAPVPPATGGVEPGWESAAASATSAARSEGGRTDCAQAAAAITAVNPTVTDTNTLVFFMRDS